MERDEFEIPVGEHTLSCGCEMRGRALLKTCDQHKTIENVSLHSVSLVAEEPNPDVGVYPIEWGGEEG